jgi:hypothetical protein
MCDATCLLNHTTHIVVSSAQKTRLTKATRPNHRRRETDLRILHYTPARRRSISNASGLTPAYTAPSRPLQAVASTASTQQVSRTRLFVRHSNHCSRRSRRRPSKMPDRNSCLVRPSSGDFNLTRFCWFVENGSAAAFDPLFCVPIVCRPSSTLPKQSSSVRYCRSAPNLEPFSDFPKRLGYGWLANRQRRSSFNVCWDSFLQTN